MRTQNVPKVLGITGIGLILAAQCMDDDTTVLTNSRQPSPPSSPITTSQLDEPWKQDFFPQYLNYRTFEQWENGEAVARCGAVQISESGDILTAAHCVTENRVGDFVGYSRAMLHEEKPVYLQSRDFVADVALLTTLAPPEWPFFPMTNEMPPLYARNLSVLTMVTHREEEGENILSIDGVLKRWSLDGEKTTLIEAIPGDSGSPVFYNGDFVGLMSCLVDSPEATPYIASMTNGPSKYEAIRLSR